MIGAGGERVRPRGRTRGDTRPDPSERNSLGPDRRGSEDAVALGGRVVHLGRCAHAHDVAVGRDGGDVTASDVDRRARGASDGSGCEGRHDGVSSTGAWASEGGFARPDRVHLGDIGGRCIEVLKALMVNAPATNRSADPGWSSPGFGSLTTTRPELWTLLAGVKSLASRPSTFSASPAPELPPAQGRASSPGPRRSF